MVKEFVRWLLQNMKKQNGMRRIYLRRQREGKAVLVIPEKYSLRGALNVLMIALLLGAVFVSCTKNVAPVKTALISTKPYDTTLYNISYGEGIRQKMLGNSGEAVRYFEQALALNPESDASAYEISIIALIRGDLALARSFGRRAISIDGENIWYLNNLTNIYFSLNEADSAIMIMEDIVRIYPDNDDTRFNLGGLYLETGEAEKAEKVFEEMRVKYGSNQQIIYALLNARDALNKRDEAEALLHEMIKAEPGDIGYRGMLAEHYRRGGEMAKAQVIYEQLFSEEPDNPLLQLSYTDFLLEDKQFEELSGFLNKVVLNDSIPKLDKISLLSRVSENEGFIKEYAAQLILSAMVFEAAYPNDLQVGFGIASVLGKAGDREGEIKRLETLLQKDPDNYPRWEELLLRVSDYGDNDKLFEIAKKVSKDFNMYPLPKLLLAFSATDKGEYDLALGELSKVRILVNGQKEYMVQILSLEADIYYRQGKVGEAFKRFDQALEINPDDILILNNYAYFLAENDMELKKADEMITKCLKEERNNTYLDTYAWVLYKMKKFDEAEQIMKEIFSEPQSDPELLEHYGYILAARNNCTEAVKYLQASLKLDKSKSYLIEEIQKCLEKR